MTTSHSAHHWTSPEELAGMLDARQHGQTWRGRCPVHQGDNPESLSIREGKDRDGNPMTLLHCFAYTCPIEDICAAMGIAVSNLFCLHPDYARQTRSSPRTTSPRLERLRWAAQPHTGDEIEHVMLEEMIVSDPAWILTCTPARAKLWELTQASPRAREAFARVLREAQIPLMHFWDRLDQEQKGMPHGTNTTTI